MRTKIMIRTPKGQAAKTNDKIKPFLIGNRKVEVNTYVNQDDNEMVWEVDGSIRDILKIQKNVAMFSNVMKSMLNSKIIKKMFRKNLINEQENELKDMLINQTECEIIKEATAEELVEANKTWWQRVKETFRKV